MSDNSRRDKSRAAAGYGAAALGDGVSYRIGQAQPRDEDPRLLRGEGRFTGDVLPEGTLHAAFVRSPVASGRLVGVGADRTDARVLTGADLEKAGVRPILPRMRFPGPNGEEMPVPPHPALATDVVRYVGQPVAVVLAATAAAARDAAEAVPLEIDEEPCVVTAEDAAASGAPLVWPELGSNHCFTVDRGDGASVTRALSEAPVVVRRRLAISRVTAVPLEPRAALAEVEGNGLRLSLGTQAPHRVQADLSEILGMDPGAIRVVGDDVGGGFGMKNGAYPEHVALLVAARATDRPVFWSSSRSEAMLSDAHAREQWAEAALALDREGRFLALDVHIRASLGALLGTSTPHPPVANLGGLAGPYRTPAIHARVEGWFTNTQCVAPYRGAGRPEASYIMERMADAAARELGLASDEIRRRNLIAPDEMPFRTGLTYTYDCGDFPGVLADALAAGDWCGFEARERESAARGRLRGRGLASVIEIAGGPPNGPHPEFAALSLAPTGEAELRTGATDSGQGHATAFRQILADRLGLDPSGIRVVAGDTEAVARGTGTFGSRTMAAAGTALWRAGDRIVRDLRPLAGEALEVSVEDLEFARGAFTVAGTDRSILLRDVLARAPAPLSAEVFEAADGATFPNGAHLCEVEIDPETGHIAVVRYAVADDVGTVINPLTLKGQIAGGVVQGLGQALMERVFYDPEAGQLLTGSLMDYALPRADDVPGFTVVSHPVLTAANPLGAKGAGEAGTVGGLPAVMNAVNDALTRAGAGEIDMPASPERVWCALAAAGVAGSA